MTPERLLEWAEQVRQVVLGRPLRWMSREQRRDVRAFLQAAGEFYVAAEGSDSDLIRALERHGVSVVVDGDIVTADGRPLGRAPA